MAEEDAPRFATLYPTELQLEPEGLRITFQLRGSDGAQVPGDPKAAQLERRVGFQEPIFQTTVRPFLRALADAVSEELGFLPLPDEPAKPVALIDVAPEHWGSDESTTSTED